MLWSFVVALALGSAKGATLKSAGGLTVQIDAKNGSYQLTAKQPAWSFAGSLNAPLQNVATSHGHDSAGAYKEISFKWSEGQIPMTGRIRLYDEKPVAVLSQTCGTAAEMPPAAFPAFTKIPEKLHVFSYGHHEFAPPNFKTNDISTPWLLFNDQADAFVISPASHFMVASMMGDGQTEVTSGFNSNLRHLPAGFTQETLVAVGAWD